MKAKYVLREVMKYLQDNKDSDVLIKDNKDLLKYIQVLKKLPDVKEGYRNEWIYIVLQVNSITTHTTIGYGVMWTSNLCK